MKKKNIKGNRMAWGSNEVKEQRGEKLRTGLDGTTFGMRFFKFSKREKRYNQGIKR